MNKNYTYMTLLTNDGYIRGVLLLKECLRSVRSNYPLRCVVTEDVGAESLNILREAGIEVLKFDKVKTPDNIMQHNMSLNKKQALIWQNVLTKFQIFNLEQFDKIIFLDADLYIFKNVDHCFEMPHMTAAVDGEYENLWPVNPHFNTGFFVIKPDKKIFESIVDFCNNLDPSKVKDYRGQPYILADQEILNLYYSDWKDQPEKHLSKYYNIFPIHAATSDTNDILENGYFVHFVGTKPWEAYETYSLCTPALNEKIGCPLFYELSFAIISMIYNNNFKDINWDKIKSNGEFYFNVAHTTRSFFRDFTTADIYIKKALAINPNDINFKKLKDQIDVCLLAQKVRPIVEQVLGAVLEQASEHNTPTVNLYMLLRVVKNLNTDDDVMIVIKYWNIILSSMNNFLSSIYTQNNWNELLYK